jgi:hypothetical protein
MQNVMYVFMLLHFLEMGMSVAKTVSSVDSWKGLVFNMWVCTLMFAIMLAFKDTLEALRTSCATSSAGSAQRPYLFTLV